MTREEAIKEVNKAFEPAFANYIITALTKGATVSDGCEDAVSRKEVFETFGELSGVWGRKALMELPPVTPTRKKGKWKTDGYGHIVCTACNEVNVDIWKSRFCPMCGAEMESENGI